MLLFTHTFTWQAGHRVQPHPSPRLASAFQPPSSPCRHWHHNLRAGRAAAVVFEAAGAEAQDCIPAAGQDTQDSSQEQEEQQGQAYFEQYHEDGSDPNKELLQSLPPASNIRVKTAQYVSSCVDVASCPAPEFPEFAVIGRSNVGKSSLINMLTNSKQLARVSKEPGKTRCINHFLINDCWYLVDLPGYGYARTGLATRDMFDKFTKDYFLTRPSLALVYLLVDSSIAPQKIDLEYAAWLHENSVPYTLVFTKADKRKKGQPRCRENVAAFKQQLLEQYGLPFVPAVLITSSETGMGRTPLLHLISTVRDSFVATPRLDEAMVAWRRGELYGSSEKIKTQPQAQPSSSSSSNGEGKGSGKGGGAGAQGAKRAGTRGTSLAGSTQQQGAQKAAAGSRTAQSGPAPSKQAGQAAAKTAPGAAGKKSRAGKALPGDDIPLPQWKVRASERTTTGQQQPPKQHHKSDD